MLDYKKLVAEFKRIGLEEKDVVFVHSSFKSFGGVEGGPQTVVDALIHILGNEGTLIVPRFNFDFSTHNMPWDIRTTPSQTGIISEFVRKDPRSFSVFHPIYSFSIIGKHAKELVKHRYKGSYSKDSIFHKLRILDAKILEIDRVYHGSTMYHYVEEMVGVDYRYLKNFTGTVTDENGKSYEDTFNIHVLDWDRNFRTNVWTMRKILEEKGVMKIDRMGDATVWYMKAEDMYRVTADAIKKNPHILCKIISQ